jgi:serine/threonine protein kinase
MGDMVSTDQHAGLVLDGKYKLIEKLGEGGMGAVYLGMHQYIGKKVAVKFLHREYAANQEVLARFYREARAATEIGHRSIIEVHDMGISPQGEPYLVMEYLEGESLGAVLRRHGPFDLATACGVMEQVLLALQAAHDKGIVHRDLKPENIFFTIRPGEPPLVKLIDFGISKMARESIDTKLTQTGSLLGTPSYMSPEQARGDNEIDPRSDLYSIGVVLYQMLTGRLPFEGTNYNKLLIKVLTENPLPPSEANPAFPIEAEALVLRALAKAREDRFQSATEMLDALKQVSAFNTRTERLSSIGAGLKTSSLTSGDLSRFIQTDSGKALAAAAFDRAAGGIGTRTPNSWNAALETRTSGPSPGFPEATTPKAWSTGQGRHEGSKNATVTYLVIGIAAVSILSVVVGVGYWGYYRRPTKSSLIASTVTPAVSTTVAPFAAPPTTRRQEDTVSIRVEGAPVGSKIYFDSALVNDNPFVVRREMVFLPLSVESEGYEPFRVRIPTDRDQVVKVTLKPVWRNIAGRVVESPEQQPTSDPYGDAPRPPREIAEPVGRSSPPRRSISSGERSRGSLQKASRGTSVAEDFE